MAQQVLFIGDSLTKGECGVNYVADIRKKFPSYKITDAGRNGDTIYGVAKRLIGILKNEQYDAIIIEAGINDILLPYIRDQSIIKKAYVNHVRKKGSIVTPIEKYGEVLDWALRGILKHTKARIIVTTLSCIGEDLGSETNRKRKNVNDQIKRIAGKYKLTVADVGCRFASYLKQTKPTGS